MCVFDAMTDKTQNAKREWDPSGHEIDYIIDMTVNYIEANINEKPCAAVKYGPLVLAIDSRYGTPISSTMIKLNEDPELKALQGSNKLGTRKAKSTEFTLQRFRGFIS